MVKKTLFFHKYLTDIIYFRNVHFILFTYILKNYNNFYFSFLLRDKEVFYMIK